MQQHAYHDLSCSRARHTEVRKVIDQWLHENHFVQKESGSQLCVYAHKGSHWGLKDENRVREMNILIRPEFGLTLVSIYHRTVRIGFIVGLMNSDILERETESLIMAINSLPDPDDLATPTS
ncbi:MAG: hypothetical protein ACFCUX_07765, partial [Candidatus Methylacidiphilales bacterium]